MRYFTIETINQAGLGDQIGTQFARLYKIGKGLNLEYKHSAISVKRSCNTKYQIAVENIYYVLKFKLINILSKFSFPLYFLAPLVYFEKIALKLDFGFLLNQKLVAFLGLKNIETIPNPTIRLNLSQAIIEAKDKTEFYDKIRNLIDFDHYETFVIDWLPEYYALSYNLDDLLNEGVTINENAFLNRRFAKVHPDLKQEKILTVHLRCGDSVSINTNYGLVTIYGNQISFWDDINDTSIKGDINRKSLGTEKYINILSQIANLKAFKVIVVSDGFFKTKVLLADYLILNYSNLNKLQGQAIKEILKMNLDQTFLYEPLNSFAEEFIVGESFEKLKKSIFAIAKAKVMLFGHGGFGYYIHSIYRPQTNTYIGHINEKAKIMLAKIKEAQESA